MKKIYFSFFSVKIYLGMFIGFAKVKKFYSAYLGYASKNIRGLIKGDKNKKTHLSDQEFDRKSVINGFTNPSLTSRIFSASV
ncbi:hypothetical protein [Candidatus Phytoplasma oryzae]|nr:hypothetical protein PIE28_02090 [Candidatus Phytoplasma oryzae]